MTKLRKQRKKKKYNYGANRKRENQKHQKNSKHNVKVGCKELRDNWDNTKSVKENMAEMGIAFNANSVLAPIKSAKKDIVAKVKVTEGEKSVSKNVTKPEVVENLEKEANLKLKEAKVQKFRFSSEQVMWISGMMDKYGDDYKAMARDPKNHYQETPKQIKGKILKFMSIPEQFAVYARERGLIERSTETEEDKHEDELLEKTEEDAKEAEALENDSEMEQAKIKE